MNIVGQIELSRSKDSPLNTDNVLAKLLTRTGT